MKLQWVGASLLAIVLGAVLVAQGTPPPVNPAVVGVPRSDAGILERQAEVLRRARESAPTPIVFIGDSITQGWEGEGREAWELAIAPLGALNLGVSGDRTEHVLWRLEQAPITRLEPRAIVLMIGTNNLGHGSSNAEQTLAGVQKVVALLREQAPRAQVLLLEIFPRGERFNALRGDILQINQALRRSAAADASGKLRALAIGDLFVAPDGSIPPEIMPDHLHLSAAGYQRWARALAPELKAALAPR